MKRFLILILLLAVSTAVHAQNDRAVNGAVFDKSGIPLANAVVKGVGTEVEFKVNANGYFIISVPYYCKHVVASCEGYLPEQIEIDGSYLVFKLKVDKNYAARKAEEEAAKAAQAQLALANQAAEAQRRAEEEARLAEEARRAEIARQKEERRKEMEEARLAAAQKRQEEKPVKTAAPKEKRAIEYRNKGLLNTFEVHYGRNFLSYHPSPVGNIAGFKYMLGYRFNNWIALSLGLGAQYNFNGDGGLERVAHERYRTECDRLGYGGGYSGYKTYIPLHIPVYLNGKFFFTSGIVQPFASLSAGIYYVPFSTILPKTELGLGVNFRLGNRSNIYLLASMDSVPYPYLEYNGTVSEISHYGKNYLDYRVISTVDCAVDYFCPTIKLGFMF